MVFDFKQVRNLPVRFFRQSAAYLHINIKYCCNSYLFYQVKREDLQGKQILATNEKYYIADYGIR